MKKLLLAGVAAFAVAGAANTASAEIDIELGGFVKGYASFVDQDETAGNEVRAFDLLRHSEVHAGGETTLDNGLTVGVHMEGEIDGLADNRGIEESYMYFSGGWGRINAGAEDGANYLLQVAAPSADANVDGIRQFIQPFNYTALLGAVNLATPQITNAIANDADGALTLDYENNASGYGNKITYLTPVVAGLQGGISYTPDPSSGLDFGGNNLDNNAGQGDVFEVAGRYEGDFEGVGFAFGAGWTQGQEETGGAGLDDQTQWNVGLDMDFAGFGLGVVYTVDNNGLAEVAGTVEDEETLVVGVDYDAGAFKLGASYMNVDNTWGVSNLDTNRYTGGVVYEYGPGMTFRGSVQYVEHENAGALGDVDGTAVLLGTQINF
ncbi:MAG: porin [Micavibrio sp.]|mgnify:CR=1 FL=1|nr:porin [Micavibrio sp.]HCK33474.1 porin [Rhodospirillaceae bacterium]